MNSKWVLLPLLICILIIPGCWDLEEIDQRAFVTALGIDLKPNGLVLLTVQLPSPKQMLPLGSNSGGKNGEEGKSFHTISATAHNVFAAFGALQSKTNRHLVVQQNRLIVLGEDTARHDVKPLLDWIFRSTKLSPQSLIFIARHRLAQEILSATPSVSKMPGLELMRASELVTKYDYTLFISAWRFRKIMVNKTQDLYAPMIDFDSNEGQYVREGLTVFNADRFVGELNREETQIFGFLTNQIKVGTMTFQTKAQDESRIFSIRNMLVVTKIKPVIKMGKPSFRVHCEVKGSLSEMTDLDQRLTLSTIERFERKAGLDIKLRVASLIRKLQSLNSDSIGFGEKLRAHDYNLWKEMNWKEVFPTVPFQVSVKVKIIRDGVFR